MQKSWPEVNHTWLWCGKCAGWSPWRCRIQLLWLLFFCRENAIHNIDDFLSFPSLTPLTSRLLCKHFSAASISSMVCAVTAFLSFFAHLCVQPSSALSPCTGDSPMQWILWVFNLFSCNSGFFGLLFQPSCTFECCLLYPHLITLCGAAGVIVVSQALFASAVQWFCSILWSQLANALPSVLLYYVLLFRTQVQLSWKETPVSLSGELVFHVENGKKFHNLSLYFLGKDLAQGSEPDRRVFPSWIQVVFTEWKAETGSQCAFCSLWNMCLQLLWLQCWPPSVGVVSSAHPFNSKLASSALPFCSTRQQACRRLQCACPCTLGGQHQAALCQGTGEWWGGGRGGIVSGQHATDVILLCGILLLRH